MRTITKEREYQLIGKYIDLEIQLQNNEGEKFYCVTSSGKSKNKQSAKIIKALLVLAKNELECIENSQANREILDLLKSLLFQLKHEISNPEIKYQISKKQGTVFNDFFVAKILKAVKTIIDAELQGLITPFLYLTSDENDSFDKMKLSTFLDEEICIIQRVKPVNYFTIRDYYYGFAGRLFRLNE